MNTNDLVAQLAPLGLFLLSVGVRYAIRRLQRALADDPDAVRALEEIADELSPAGALGPRTMPA